MPMTRIRQLVERRVSPRIAGWVRIVVGLAAGLSVMESAPILARLHASEMLRIPFVEGGPTIVDLPLLLVVALWVAAAALFTVGLRTTLAGVVLTGTLAGALLADQQLYTNHLYLLTLLVALLTLARAGSALSVDARLGRGRHEVPDWPLQLMRIQVSIVYAFAALSKINGVYLSGSVVAAMLRHDGPLAMPVGWRTFEVMAAAAMLAILVEGFLAVALWLPRWRRTAFVVGLILHAGLVVWFEPGPKLAVFGLIALAPYALFLRAEPGSRVVVWDDSCGFCSRWVAWIQRLDWLSALRFVPGSNLSELKRLGVSQEEADHALQLRSREQDGSGFGAVVASLEVMPISFLWAPLLRVWPVWTIGNRAYRRVAARRSCSLSTAAIRPGVSG
jgi:predicted DCC family thiol-disulfide oxidoreductase YuxK